MRESGIGVGRQWWGYYLHWLDNYLHFSNTPDWLLGAQLTVVSCVTALAGLTCIKAAYRKVIRRREVSLELAQKPAQHRERTLSMDTTILEEQGLSAWTPIFGVGFVVYLCGYALNILALVYASETTVAVLGCTQVLVNLLTCYAFLHERFTTRDALATVACVLSMVAAVVAMPRMIPGHLRHFPIPEFLAFCKDMWLNVGFMCYFICWSILFFFCVNANFIVFGPARETILAFSLPTSAGLCTSSTQFFLKLSLTLLYHSEEHPEVWDTPTTNYIIGTTIFLFVLSLYFTLTGIRLFDCRSFVPTTFAVSTVLILIQGMLFFGEWEWMTYLKLLAFGCACFSCVASAFMICSRHNTVEEPDMISGGALLDSTTPSECSSPGGNRSEISARETQVLSIMNEHTLRFQSTDRVQVKNSYTQVGTLSAADTATKINFPHVDVGALQTDITASCFGRQWQCLSRLSPALLIFGFPVALYWFTYIGWMWLSFSALTVYLGFNCWKHGLHIALFTNVGRMKIEAYQDVNFERMYSKAAAVPGTPEAAAPGEFRDVVQAVIVPNYKEDIEVMREALESIAASRLARGQIAVILGMEAREAEAPRKAEALKKEFADRFYRIVASFHPPGLAGETPGKSSNTRWAARELFGTFLPEWGVKPEWAVITVADADSEFHREYFSAVTYGFLAVPANKRFTTIWQPPIIHYKNYHTQPAVVRLASLLTSQHELANLADPSAPQLPYSTYSISATLAQLVDFWDPDWISEDWHMCCKCFLSTVGSLKVQPVFLPVMNYTPEGATYLETLAARWAQGKRHALGVSELVYFTSLCPYILLDCRQPCLQRLVLFFKGFALWVKMFLVHAIMATMVMLGPLNGFLVGSFYRHQVYDNISSWTFLANCVFQAISCVSYMVFVYTSVLLYLLVRTRVVGHEEDENKRVYGGKWQHFLKIFVESSLWSPFFFFVGAAAEWIAALKTAATHQFDYEVALKPQVAPKVAPA